MKYMNLLSLYFVGVWLSVFFCGCINTGEHRVEAPLVVSGRQVDELEASGGIRIQLERADVAFGPLYLCAGAQAGALCDEARMEWLGTAVVDVLDGEEVEVGQLQGITGRVRSWMYDFAISSQLTGQQNFVLDAARQLGDQSAVFQGVASNGVRSIPFEIRLRLEQNENTGFGVPVVRKSSSEPFSADISGQGSLAVAFDATRYFVDADFRSYFEHQSECSSELAGQTICIAEQATTCAASGEQKKMDDCAAKNEICIPHQGCVERFNITEETQIYRALRASLLTNAGAKIQWRP